MLCWCRKIHTVEFVYCATYKKVLLYNVEDHKMIIATSVISNIILQMKLTQIYVLFLFSFTTGHMPEWWLPKETHPTNKSMSWIRTHILEVCITVLSTLQHQNAHLSSWCGILLDFYIIAISYEIQIQVLSMCMWCFIHKK